MLFPSTRAWTRRQKAGIVASGVVGLVLFCALVFLYERNYRGPSGSVFCGTWETDWAYDPTYMQLNPDQTFSMFSVVDGVRHEPFGEGRWYAGGPNLYLRFDSLLMGDGFERAWVFQIVEIQPAEIRLRYLLRNRGDGTVLTFRRAHLNSPPASNHAMERTADRFALNF